MNTYRHRLADIALPLLLRQLLLVAVLRHHRVLGECRWSRRRRDEELWRRRQRHAGAFIAVVHKEIGSIQHGLHYGGIQHFPHLFVSRFGFFAIQLLRLIRLWV